MLGKRKNKILLQAILSFLFILLVFGGAWYFAVTYKSPTTQDYVDRAATNLEDWASELGVETKTLKSIYWDWIDEKNNLLPLIGNEFFLGTTNGTNIGKYGKLSSKNLEKINSTFFAPIILTGKEYFDQSRFFESKRNRRKNEQNRMNETFRGYEKNMIKCLLRLTPRSDPFGNLFCGVVDEKQIKLQKQFSSIFSTKYNSKKSYSFRVEKMQGRFAKGTFSQTTLGYTWIAKKEDKKWKIIWKGEEIPLCTQMQSLNVPKNIYLKCYNQ